MKILISTCRNPSRRIRSFTNELAVSLPEAIRVNRGKSSLAELAYLAFRMGASTMLLIGSYRGNPGRIYIYKITPEGYKLVYPIVVISGVKLLREMRNSAPIRTVKSSLVACSERTLDKIREFSEKLALALNFPYIEVNDLASLLGIADSIIWVEHTKPKDLAKITFLHGEYLKPCGPMIRIRDVKWPKESLELR